MAIDDFESEFISHNRFIRIFSGFTLCLYPIRIQRIHNLVNSSWNNKFSNYIKAHCMCDRWRCKRSAGDIQAIPARYIPVVQIRSSFSIYHYNTDGLYKNPASGSFHHIRNYYSGNDVSDQDYPAPYNFSKQEYFNILFDFIPLCAGNSACFDSNKIFYRSCLIGLGYFES